MLAESRETVRQNIHLEEINGSFWLDAHEKRFDPVMYDVSVSGAGLQLAEPLEVGINVELAFMAGDWKISVQGRIVWCRLASGNNVDTTKESYRLGIKFNPRHTNNNVIFFMASRSMVNPPESDS